MESVVALAENVDTVAVSDLLSSAQVRACGSALLLRARFPIESESLTDGLVVLPSKASLANVCRAVDAVAASLKRAAV